MTNPTEKVIINPTEKLRERIHEIICGRELPHHWVCRRKIDQILKACKEGIEIEGITYRLKFVSEIWRLPFQALNPKVKDQFLNLVMNEINSQTKDIEL